MPIIAVISDIHVGHPAAVWPESFITDKGNEIVPNAPQEVLLQYWKDFWNQPDVKSADYIVNMEAGKLSLQKRMQGTQLS